MDNTKVYLREKQKYVTVPINPAFTKNIDTLVVEKWQQMINLVANIFEVRAGLIMRITEESMEVFLRSENKENPYPSDGKDQLGHGLYCETVIGENSELYIDNSLNSKTWQDNPDVKLDMIAYYGLPIKNPDGSFFGTICVLDDKTMANSARYRDLLGQFRSSIEKDLQILQLKEGLEERVKERTAQLEASNKELETLAYSISHDLRSPLRAMSGFSEFLLKEYENKLDEQGKHYLKRIINAAGQMGNLIEDLLQVAKIARAELECKQLDLSLTAQEIINRLKRQDPHRQAEFHITKELNARGDKELMKIVLENLLSNAWKFTSGSEKTIIELGQLADGSDKVFYVRDNGAGFDAKYADKIFGVFQRLHKTSEYPGTGVGLAISKRIIDRHGGRIWAESEAGKGTTIYFTLGLSGLSGGRGC